MYRKPSEFRPETREKLRGGVGKVEFQHLLEQDEMLGKAIMCAIMTVEPGNEIGLHAHNPDAEIYYMLEGELDVTDNGTPVKFRPGEVLFTGNGNTHSVFNNSDKTARILAIVLA